jgi:hypothetical protein
MKIVDFCKMLRYIMQRGLYPRMDVMMQAVQWYLLKSVTVEISIANLYSAGNKKKMDGQG